MRLLFMMAQPYFPQQAGGMQTLTEQLAQIFEASGHEIAVAAELSLRDRIGMIHGPAILLRKSRHLRDNYNGGTVFRVRGITNHVDAVIDAFQPDCVILQSMDAMLLAHRINDRAIPLVVCWHDVYLDRMGGSPSRLVARFIANSEFTASVYQHAFDVSSTVIPPLIKSSLYAVTPAQEQYVTFINPVPDKGLDLALDIAARCPDIPFEFVESWVLRRGAKKQLLQQLSRLPNVRFTPRQSDMRPIYARSRIVLAPSQCREGWGRVASEAHVSGIPVIGSRLGGLIESIGPGGIQLDPKAPAAEWAEALRSVWTDADLYQTLSERARDYAQRPALDEALAVKRILAEIHAAIAVRRAYPAPAPEAHEQARRDPADATKGRMQPGLEHIHRVRG